MRAQGLLRAGGRRQPGAALAALPVVVLPVLAMALGLATAATATPVKHFRASSRADLAAGTFEGVSVDPWGQLRLAPAVERVASFQQPFVLAAAATADGWVVGTGNDGEVLQVSASGKVSTLWKAPEPQVFAVLADPDGTVYAATSPNGKVYRLRGAKSEVYFDPKATYIWALARAADGSLLVGTGTDGRLFAVGKAGEGRLLLDVDDTHVRSLAVLPDGSVLVGTADRGLILHLAKDGTLTTLFDADVPEVVSLIVGAQGDVWAATIAAEGSLAGAASPPAAAASGTATSTSSSEPTAVVTVGEAPAEAAPRGPRAPARPLVGSEVLHLRPSGGGAGWAVESVWRFQLETVYALAFGLGKLWVATGLEGQLFSWDGSTMVLERDLEETQIVALLAGQAKSPELAVLTTNGGGLFRLRAEPEKQGTYLSPVLDAGARAHFGTLSWAGEVPAGTKVELAARSGMSAEPDDTWSPWSAAGSAAEVALGSLPHGRFVQWRAVLAAARGTSPVLAEVDLAYQQENLRPVIASLLALDPGEILVPAAFNPSNQAYEPAHPNRDGIFTTLVPSTGPEERQRTLWKQGYQTLRWEAADPNGDPLVYRLDAARALAGDADRLGWLEVARDLKESSLSFDATVLPDGPYRFRLTAAESGEASGLETSTVSTPVLIDHSPPQLVRVERVKERLSVELRDAWSPLREVVAATDGKPWQALAAADGLLDGRQERFSVEVPPGVVTLLLRVTDAAANVVTFDLLREVAEKRP